MGYKKKWTKKELPKQGGYTKAYHWKDERVHRQDHWLESEKKRVHSKNPGGEN